MATVTLYNHINFVAGGELVEDKTHKVLSTGGADTLTLPAGSAVGFSFLFTNLDTDVKTLAAPSGETIGGNVTTIAQNETVAVVKSAATVWTATTYAAADV